MNFVDQKWILLWIFIMKTVLHNKLQPTIAIQKWLFCDLFTYIYFQKKPV